MNLLIILPMMRGRYTSPHDPPSTPHHHPHHHTITSLSPPPLPGEGIHPLLQQRLQLKFRLLGVNGWRAVSPDWYLVEGKRRVLATGRRMQLVVIIMRGSPLWDHSLLSHHLDVSCHHINVYYPLTIFSNNNYQEFDYLSVGPLVGDTELVVFVTVWLVSLLLIFL